VYPVTRETPAQHHHLTKILAILLLVVAGALVFTVWQQRHQKDHVVSYEPRPIAQRPDDKLGADEQATIDVFGKFSRSVVHVTSLNTRRNQLTLDVNEIPEGIGSGFVWDQDGHIVTNFHVVQMGDHANVTLNDGTTYAATIVGKTPDKDLAVLHIDAPPQKLLPLPVGQSATLRVGQKVLAIGNPFGLDQTLTTGVISGLGREIKSVTQRPIHDVIQTDAPINPGNSGGPLLDSSGRLVGVTTAIRSPSGGSTGVGLAIPVDMVNRIVPQLIARGRAPHPSIGIIPVHPDLVARDEFVLKPAEARKFERPLAPEIKVIGIAAAFHDQAGQMFFGFSECSFRNEKRYLFAIRLDRLAHALPQNGPHQNIGVNNQSLTWHSASSRGQPGGFPYTPSSARLHWRLRTRSSRQGLSQRPASLRVRPSGFAFVRGYSSRQSLRAA